MPAGNIKPVAVVVPAALQQATHGPPDIPIITPAAARAAGLNRYATGQPCRYGHVAERYANNGECVECRRLRGEAKRAAARKRAGIGPRQQPVRGTTMAEEEGTAEIHPASIDKRLDAIQSEQRAMRAEWRQQSVTLRDIHRDFKAGLARMVERIDRIEDELTTTIKVEIGGAMAMMETRLEQRLDDSIEQRLDDTIKRIDALERRAAGEGRS